MTPDDVERIAEDVCRVIWTRCLDQSEGCADLDVKTVITALTAHGNRKLDEAAKIAETLEIQCGSEVKVPASPNQIAQAIRNLKEKESKP